MKTTYRSILLFIVATMILFFPRRLYIAGMYGFRIITLLVLILFFIFSSGRFKTDRFFKNPFLWLYVGAISIVYVQYMAFTGWAGFLLDSVVLLFLVTNLIDSRKTYQSFVAILCKMVILYSILCIFEFFTGFNIWNVVTGRSLVQIRYGFYRTFGSMTTPINNGFFLILSMPVLMDAILHNKKNKMYIAAYILAMITIICTLSRAPILVAIGLNLVWLMKRGVLSYLRQHLLACIVFVICIILIMQIPVVSNAVNNFILMFQAITDESVAESISSNFGSNAKGVGERMELYEWVWRSVQGNLIWGKGPTQAFDYVWIRWDGQRELKQSIENQYLACLFRNGMVGLVTMILFYLSLLKRHFHLKEIIMRHTLTVDFLWFTTLVGYFIVIFTAAIADDIKMFFIMMALYSMRTKLFTNQHRTLEGKPTRSL